LHRKRVVKRRARKSAVFQGLQDAVKEAVPRAKRRVLRKELGEVVERAQAGGGGPKAEGQDHGQWPAEPRG